MARTKALALISNKPSIALAGQRVNVGQAPANAEEHSVGNQASIDPVAAGAVRAEPRADPGQRPGRDVGHGANSDVGFVPAPGRVPSNSQPGRLGSRPPP